MQELDSQTSDYTQEEIEADLDAEVKREITQTKTKKEAGIETMATKNTKSQTGVVADLDIEEIALPGYSPEEIQERIAKVVGEFNRGLSLAGGDEKRALGDVLGVEFYEPTAFDIVSDTPSWLTVIDFSSIVHMYELLPALLANVSADTIGLVLDELEPLTTDLSDTARMLEKTQAEKSMAVGNKAFESSTMERKVQKMVDEAMMGITNLLAGYRLNYEEWAVEQKKAIHFAAVSRVKEETALAMKEWIEEARQGGSKILSIARVPNYNTSHTLPDSIITVFKGLAHQMAMEGKASNCLITGPAGIGKTSIPSQFAAWLGLPLVIVEAYEHRYASSFFGMTRLVKGETVWDDSRMVKALENGNCVVCVDEVNRAEPTASNAFFPLMDWRREAYVEEAKKFVTVGDNVFFFGTANIGSSYTGTHRLDAALFSRFGVVLESDYPDKKGLCKMTEPFYTNNKDLPRTFEADIDGFVPHGMGKHLSEKLIDAVLAVNNLPSIATKIPPRDVLEFTNWYSLVGGDAIIPTILNKFQNTALAPDRKTAADAIKKVLGL